jgi:hypothetical protein
MTVLVLLCPPLFFARRREWPAFVLNRIPYVVSLLLIGAGLYQFVICAVDSAATEGAYALAVRVDSVSPDTRVAALSETKP